MLWKLDECPLCGWNWYLKKGVRTGQGYMILNVGTFYSPTICTLQHSWAKCDFKCSINFSILFCTAVKFWYPIPCIDLNKDLPGVSQL